MNSELAVLMFSEVAIGLAFYTYLPHSGLIFFSYFGIDDRYRGDRSAEIFWKFIKDRLRTNEEFKPCEGIAFEIEPFDELVVRNILDHRETSGSESIREVDEERILFNVHRLSLYESAGAFVFADESSGIPLTYRSPCIDRDLDVEDWESGESELWIMFYYLGDKRDLSPAATRTLWSKSVHLLIDAIGLSQLTLRPGKAKEYLKYMNSLYDRIELSNAWSTPVPKKYFDNEIHKILLRRVRKLAPRHNRKIADPLMPFS